MRNVREWSHLLAELLQNHYAEPPAVTRLDESGEMRPPLRPRDWELLDEVRVGNVEYLLLRRVQPAADEFDRLTERELDALRRASTGASNREVAQCMGISAATVGVLLARACRKVGAAGRDGLIRRFRRRQSRTDVVVQTTAQTPKGEFTNSE